MRAGSGMLWLLVGGCYPWVGGEEHPPCWWFPDADQDGFGDPSGTIRVDCSATELPGHAQGLADCDDGDARAHPGQTWWRDDDGDGFGDPGVTEAGCPGVAGTWVVASPGDEDCDDADPDAFPGQRWWPDEDGDGFGDAARASSCAPGAEGASVLDDGDAVADCDDREASVNPGAVEACDGVDTDCVGGVPADERDDDGDGHVECGHDPASWLGPSVAGGDDCDDDDDDVHVGAPERCDGLDDDCDRALGADERDDDGDRFVECDPAVVWASIDGGGDCLDTDATVRPFAEERCDGLDGDCSGAPALDERDDDGDGWVACVIDAGGWDGPVAPDGGGDCADGDPGVNPAATDEGCDGADTDCDGALDPDESDVDGDGVVVCAWSAGTWVGDGRVTGGGDCDDGMVAGHLRTPDADERCDGLDNDCDLAVPADEVDGDGDAFVVCAFDPLTWATGGVVGGGDCLDTDALAHPGALELCDGVDNDCAAGLSVVERDDDGDGAVPCTFEPSRGWRGPAEVTGDRDCDDTDALVFEGNPEVCDGKDNDCVLGIDNGLEQKVFFVDGDRDGFGDPGSAGEVSCAEALAGRAANFDDCDDADGAVNPEADEWCDAEDTDCDGGGFDDDAEDAVPFHPDRDGDGHGNPSESQRFCDLVPPTGWVVATLADDCDDTTTERSPALAEVCDGVDNDCDVDVDDNPIARVGDTLGYFDGDLDGFGDQGNRSCNAGGGFVAERVEGFDCRDDEPLIFPGAPEVPGDALDGDCDGDADGSGLTSSIVLDGDPGPPQYFGAGLSKAAGGALLVSAPGSAPSSVYLFEPPFSAGLASAEAVTVFRGPAGSNLDVAGDNGLDLTDDGIEDYVLVDRQDDDRVIIVPGPVLPGVVDPYTTGIVITFDSAHPILQVEPIPSVTTDGHPDLLVSTRFDVDDTIFTPSCLDDGRVFAGSISLFDGPFDADRTIDDRFAWQNGGAYRESESLHVLGGAGDLDQDGSLDLAFGAPTGGSSQYTGTGWCDTSGSIHVVRGPVLPGEMPTALEVRGPQVILGFEYGDGGWLGHALSIRRDVSGDGVPDLVAGAPYNNATNHDYGGAVGRVVIVEGPVLFPEGGRTGAVFVDSLPRTVYEGTQYTRFGFDFDLEDVDDDGLVDLLAARPGNNGSYLLRGPLVSPGTHPYTDAFRFWTAPVTLHRSLMVVDPLGTRGEVIHGAGGANADIGQVHIFPGEDLFGP